MSFNTVKDKTLERTMVDISPASESPAIMGEAADGDANAVGIL